MARLLRVAVLASCVALLAASCANAETALEAAPDQAWALHGQATVVEQGTAAFSSPYRGANSLDPAARGRETADITVYVGVRPWKGAELWVNGEMDQGFGLSDTLGIAGFPSGEAYKVGKATPYLKLPRLFLRQTINLEGAAEPVEADLNQLRQTRTADRLVITVGKFGVTDVFDASDVAHDPRHDFLNWSLIDAGTFDYAADAWGFTYGGTIEAYVGRWTARLGVFNLSDVPNSEVLGSDFSQFQMIGEVEHRHTLWGHDGKVAITAFLSRGRMARFEDAVALAQAKGGVPDVAAVRRYQGRAGISVHIEQAISDQMTLFARGGLDDGSKESYEFSDIDRTLSAGASFKGVRWGRPNDTLALAGVVNGISGAHQRYLAAGGLGILVGDGRLPHPGAESILETYYDLQAVNGVNITLDYQFVNTPAYNRDRGPVSIFALRLHGQF